MSTSSPESSRAVGVHFDGDLQRTLLDAALVELQDVGAERMSLRGVARRAGVSHAAPAHHFGDKTGLLTALAVEGFDSFHGYLRRAHVPVDDPATGLLALGRSYVEFADRQPAHFDLIFRRALIDTADPEYIRAGGASYAALRDHVEEMQRLGWHPDEPLLDLTTAVWGLVHGLCSLRSQGALDATTGESTTDDLLRVAGTLIV